MFPEESLKGRANRNNIDRLIGVAPKSTPKKVKVSSDIMNAGKEFQGKRPGSIIEWNDMTGTPKWLKGDLSVPSGGTASEAGRNFLIDNHELMGVSEDLKNIYETDTFEWGGMRHVRYRQNFENIPVFGGELLISMEQNNKVRMVAGDIFRKISFRPEREPISVKEAIRVAMEDLGKDNSLRGRISHETVLYPVDANGFAKVYHLTIPMRTPIGDWDYFIDIQSGEIVDSFNSMRFYFAARARVYPENPEDTALATHVLRNLKWPYKKLEGLYCRVFNEDGPEAMAGGNYRFDFPPENTHFDESQVYFAADDAYAYFRGRGFRGFTVNNPYGKSHDGQLGANVHVGTRYDNAFYSPVTGMIYFGDGSYEYARSGFRDMAKEVDIVVHEFTHAVIDEYRPGIAGIDGGALHEGYADYFACSLMNEPEIGEYVAPEQEMKGIVRTCDNSDRYPASPYEPHARGKVWAGACWDLRKELGQEVTDYLIFGSIIYLPRVPSFRDAKNALLIIDDLYCGREYRSIITNIFENQRGIPV
ncbi:MAG: hypothetical protein C4560_05685 [Nitrospiraceae bacterium]|nr:MAG: hypothetical protein C4560_05685 [Nitrospiraceae bacterium]